MSHGTIEEIASDILLTAGEARTTVSLHGAQVMSYIPATNLGEVIWTGGHAPAPGTDCWGGIPLVWPWFMTGHGPDHRGPFHGPARRSGWSLDSRDTADGLARATFVPTTRLADAAGAPIPLDPRLTVTLAADSLRLDLATTNPTDTGQPLEHCFHSYFRVGDVTRLSVHGLEGTTVQDNRRPGSPQEVQLIPLTLDGPAARIFRPFPARVTIDDPVLGRRIVLQAPGARQLVLWNAGPPRTENGNQTGEAEWQSQLAIEPLTGIEHQLTLEPGGHATLTLEITCQPASTQHATA